MPRRSSAASVALLAGALMLVGCVTPRPHPPALTQTEARAGLAALGSFRFEGRAAISQGEKGSQATLAWEQQGEDVRLRLSGPLGAGALRVEMKDEVLSLQDSRGTRLSGADAEAALAEQLGFAPPLGSLRWWLLGLPAPEGEALEVLDEAGRLSRLQQQGWQVDYLEYRDQQLAQGLVAMPRRLRATRETLDLRLVIDRWDLIP